MLWESLEGVIKISHYAVAYTDYARPRHNNLLSTVERDTRAIKHTQ
jgi:hypothetical protein